MAIVDYISDDNPDAALALMEEIQGKVALLPAHPERCRPGRVVGTRELVVRPNYIVIYTESPGMGRCCVCFIPRRCGPDETWHLQTSPRSSLRKDLLVEIGNDRPLPSRSRCAPADSPCDALLDVFRPRPYPKHEDAPCGR
ncbi:type II toxin-antitoxin system RelE/ParE family toxin [Mameliella sp. CS4]|uniref:type II toxin-antitoxin system RelE/ParE family toxin n=1 Tax=Mameliella sp. CS4 TaxID=2862329 RepID=UPI0021074A6E|nr:type II toxin-antitoxin system RelE/ParE family toxin [Mameliella sp. CS4]